MIVRCLKLARKEGIKLRRRYGKEIKQRKLECRFAGHSKNRAKARKAVKRKIWKVLSRDQGFTLSIRTLGRILKKLLRLNRIVPVAFYFGRIKPKRRRPFKHHARRWRYGMKARQPGELMQIDHMSVGFSEGFQLKEFKATCPVTGTTIMRTYSSASSRNARRFLDDADGDALHSLRIDTLPGTGSLALNSTAVTAMQVIAAADIPNLVYTPVANVNGAATFTFSVSDGTDFSTPPATATITVNAVNADPSGTVTITGTPQVGQTLTADTSGIADADGPAALSFTYQWLANDGTTNEAINGATSPTYLLTGNESGETITVSVRYTDAGNTAEGPLTSAPFGPVDTNEMRTVLLADGRSITVATHNTADTTDPQMITELNTGEVDSSVALDPEGLDNVKLLPENEANNNVTGILLAAGSAVDITTNAGACTDDNPCRLTLSYTTDDLEELGGITSDQLAIFHYTSINNNNVWEELAEADVTAQTITASTSSFSPFALGTLVFNTGPTADAGPDQTVEEGASVTLDGSASSDPENANLTYTWNQTDGQTVTLTLTGDTTATPTFTAPENLSANAVLVFSLTVNDGTSDSTPDPVRIGVTTDAPARQQALKTGLAALGRGLATSATDAIGQRLKPAATGPETSSFSGLSLANCIANMTSLTPTDTASADGADRSAWFDPRDMGGDIGSAEPDKDSRNNGRNPLGACRLPDSGQLARSAFVISLNGNADAGAGGGYWSLWGRGDLSRFEGRPQTGLDLDGNLRAGYLGLDYRLSSGGLVGVALSRSEGEIDIGTADDTLDKGTLDKGTLDTRLNSVYPYGYWSPRAGMGLWGLLGVGSGDATLSHRETDFATDLDMRMGALGLRQVVQTLGSFELALKADAFVVELESEDGPGLLAVSAQARRARLLLEASHRWQPHPDERLGTSLELGARVDGGDADEGAGAELGVGLEYSNTRLGLRAQWRAQGLLAHSASGFEEWGTSLNVELDPGVSGRGLALGLADELEMELFGGRNASGNRSPEHLLGLTGRLRF